MAKYTFETTTVGEMVDNPKIRALVEEMSPDGTWKPLQFAFGAGVVSIPCPWPCYGVKVFRIR